MRIVVASLLFTLGSGALGCGDDGGKTTPKIDAPANEHKDAPEQPIDAKDIDAPPGAKELTVKNFDNWCSVTVDGGAASSAAIQHITITADKTITLTAKRASAAFEVSGNMWHHTDGDTGAGEPGTITNPGDPATKTSTAMVAVVASSSKCVWVCCPFAGGGGCDSTSAPEQCP